MSEESGIVPGSYKGDNDFTKIDDDVKQIIYGGLLGSMFLCHGSKHDYVTIKHASKHEEWLNIKAEALQGFASKKAFYQYKNTVSWRSVAHPYFSHLRTRFYDEDQKVITMDWLDQLRDLAISVWFGDAGHMTGRHQRNASLRTQPYGEKGNEIIAKYFNEVGMQCSMNRQRHSYVIVFTVEGTRNLFKLIANSFPSPRLLKALPFFEKKN